MFSKVIVHPGGGLTLYTPDQGEMFVGPSLSEVHIEGSPTIDGIKVKFVAFQLAPPLVRKKA